MKFNEYKENDLIYYIQFVKNEIVVNKSKVIKISAPYVPMNTNPTNILSQSKIVDITLNIDNKDTIYSFPENSSIVTTNTGLIISDVYGIINEIKNIKDRSENALNEVDKHKKYIELCNKYLLELDPNTKKDAETDARFRKLEDSVTDISSSIEQIKNMLLNKHS